MIADVGMMARSVSAGGTFTIGVQATMTAPADPLQCGLIDGFDGAPGSSSVDDLRLEQAVDLSATASSSLLPTLPTDGAMPAPAKHAARGLVIRDPETIFRISYHSGAGAGRWGGRRPTLDGDESGGSEVQAPTTKGFGSVLPERVPGRRLGGEVETTSPPERRTVRITARLDRLPDGGAA